MQHMERATSAAGQLGRNAEILITDFVRLSAGERVLVVGDATHEREADALASSAKAAGATVARIDATPEVERLLGGADFWTSLPDHIVEAVNGSNVTIFTVDETFAFRLDHKVAETFRTGPACSVFKVDEGMDAWQLGPGYVDEILRTSEAIIGAIDGSDQVEVTSRAGTSVRMSLAGRRCLPVLPVPERGAPYGLSVPLWGEYNWAPVEGSVEGRIVIDGLTEAGSRMGVVAEPVVMTVEAGRVVDVEGGADADDFRKVLATDVGAAVVAELGVGGNPAALAGRETEKALLGTVHFGFGSNAAYPGGQNRSVVHVDGVVRDVSLSADGVSVLSDGKLVALAPSA